MAGGAATDASIHPRVLQEAAEWLLRFRDGEMDDASQADWRHWLARSEENARAWQRAERLAGLLGNVPSSIGAEPIRRARRNGRRTAIAALAGLLVGPPAAWLAWRREPWQYALADHVSAIGQQRAISLDDGGHLYLNTDSRVDVQYGEDQRRLVLLRGEILVQTAPDPHAPARPFFVQTRHGTLQALGTRFSVRQFDDRSRVAVLEGAVRVSPSAYERDSYIVAAGEQADFGRSGVYSVRPLQPLAVDWVRGALSVQAMPLAQVVAELARYRSGVLRCDPAVAAIAVSGVFQLADTDKALRLLESVFPVRVCYRSRYWITVVAR